MINDKKMCTPYSPPDNSSDVRTLSYCGVCICNRCFNHIPFGDCSLGYSLCIENDINCEPVSVCSGFTVGSLAKSVRALQ